MPVSEYQLLRALLPSVSPGQRCPFGGEAGKHGHGRWGTRDWAHTRGGARSWSRYRCERKVTTIVCVHEPLCNSRLGCGKHGVCRDASCVCEHGWSGQFCDERLCNAGAGCRHGACFRGKCSCEKGWQGDDCSTPQCNGGVGCGPNGECQVEVLQAASKALDDRSARRESPRVTHCRCYQGYHGDRCELAVAGVSVSTVVLALALTASVLWNAWVCCKQRSGRRAAFGAAMPRYVRVHPQRVVVPCCEGRNTLGTSLRLQALASTAVCPALRPAAHCLSLTACRRRIATAASPTAPRPGISCWKTH